MGALVSLAQRRDVLNTVTELEQECERVFGNSDSFSTDEIDSERGAFLAPILLQCNAPNSATLVHAKEAFGPVATLMPYSDTDNAAELLNRGGGSLVASVFTHDTQFARQMVVESAACHGRLYFNNRDSASEATQHGSPLPHMVHGGPGRAGGGEELGGVRGVKHYMQRTAVQGSPNLLSAITHQWVPGSTETTGPAHPFRRSFNDLALGETVVTESRVITLEDIEQFAHFTGDTFYAHMDEDAARANPFFPGRVAHGYLLLSFAAGLFVEPSPGPVLANTGLNELSFQKPVSPGDAITVHLTVKRKTPRTGDYGEVRWHVKLSNQHHDTVATYELLTMVMYQQPNSLNSS